MASRVLALDTIADKSSMFFLDVGETVCIFVRVSVRVKWTRRLKNEETNEEKCTIQYTLITSHASTRDSHRRDTYVRAYDA